jgi:hypothetical protein
MSRADHFFPQRAFRGQSIAIAQEADRSSWLRAPARTYIIEPLVVFDATSIFTNYVAMKLWRPAYRTTISTSIAVRAATALLIAAWSSILLGQRSIVIWYVAFFVGGLLTLVCAYSTYFSPWGAHNFAITFLVVALFCLERTLRRWSHHDLRWPALVFCGITQVFALYSYSTCTLLLLLGVPMSILLMKDRPWKDRFVASLGYILFVLVVDSPVLIRFHDSPTHPGGNPHPLQTILASGVGWWLAGSAYYSWEGFLLGLLGVALLWRRKIFVPACMVLIHFLLWTFMPSFTWNSTATGLRTFNYLLPWLALGGAATACAAIENKRRRRALLTAAVALLLIAHWILQIRMISSEQTFLRRAPLFNDLYLNRQGEVGYFVSQIDEHLPRGATLVAGDAEILDAFEVLTRRRDLLDKLPPPADSLDRWSAQGKLRDYLEIHNRLHFDCTHAYALVGQEDTQQLSSLLRDPALGCGSNPALVASRRFSLPEDRVVRPLVLYSVERERGDAPSRVNE